MMFAKVVRTAARWQDPDYPPRVRAAIRTMQEGNRFTEEALAFAINHEMRQITERSLAHWVAGRVVEEPRTVGVLNAGNIPLVGLQDFLGVLLSGNHYRGACSSRSPYLLPAFMRDLKDELPALPAEFTEVDSLFASCNAIIASGSETTMEWVRKQSSAAGIANTQLLLRGHGFAVAVVDGNESQEELEGLSEDILLHEGMGCRNVALLWAPQALSPDSMLESMAAVRAVFPAHKRTPRALSTQQALLRGLNIPHTDGEGLGFLLSKGEPEPQGPGHVRWTAYETMQDVRDYLIHQEKYIELVIASPRLSGIPNAALAGSAQRPSLGWQAGTIDFLSSR